MKLVGVMGAKGAGKDHFFNIAQALYGKGRVRRFAFADALRHEIEAGFLVDGDCLLNEATKETPLEALALKHCSDAAFLGILCNLHGPDLDMDAPRSPRWIMQQWGTEYRQGIDPDYWLKWFGKAYRIALLEGVDLFICTDTRFLQEIRAIEMLGGELVAVRNAVAEARVGENAHVSETTWMGYFNRHDILNPHPNDTDDAFVDAVRCYLDPWIASIPTRRH